MELKPCSGLTNEQGNHELGYGLSTDHHQATAWTNADIFPNVPLYINKRKSNVN